MTDDGKREDSSIKIILIVINTGAKCQQEKLRLHCLQGGWSLSRQLYLYRASMCENNICLIPHNLRPSDKGFSTHLGGDYQQGVEERERKVKAANTGCVRE